MLSDADTRHISSSSTSETKAVRARKKKVMTNVVYTDDQGVTIRATVSGLMSVGKFIKNTKRIEKGDDLDVVVANDKTDASRRIHDVKTKKWSMKHTWEHQSFSSSRRRQQTEAVIQNINERK